LKKIAANFLEMTEAAFLGGDAENAPQFGPP
jgi:hypothetical protein